MLCFDNALEDDVLAKDGEVSRGKVSTKLLFDLDMYLKYAHKQEGKLSALRSKREMGQSQLAQERQRWERMDLYSATVHRVCFVWQCVIKGCP